MSLFGNGHSKFRAGTTFIELENSLLDPTFLALDYVRQISAVNGNNIFIEKGNRSRFKVLIHLFKYADPSAKFNEILAYEETPVIFYPFQDGEPIKDFTGAEVNFYIAEIDLYWLETPKNQDIMVLTFEAEEYTSLITEQCGYGYDYGNNYGGDC